MSNNDNAGIRNEVFLKATLKRGTEIAKALSHEDVKGYTNERYQEIVLKDKSFEPLFRRYQKMVADSYEVLRLGASYAATEYRTIEDNIFQLEESLLQLTQGKEKFSDELVKDLQECFKPLDSFILPHQRMTEQLVQAASERGVIDAIADEQLFADIVKKEFPNPTDYEKHVFSLLNLRMEIAEPVSDLLVAQGGNYKEIGKQYMINLQVETIPIQEALRYETRRCMEVFYK